VSEISIAPVSAPLGDEWTAMTFPSYRQAVALVATPHTDSEGARMIACTAVEDGQPAGLGLAQLPKDASQPAEILSLFVRADVRNRGVGTRLVEGLEGAARTEGRDAIMGVYMTGKPSIPIVEHIFAKRGFEPPVLRKAAVRITPEQAVNCPWWGRGRLPAGGEMFMWRDITPEERAQIQRSHAENPWIDPLLEPWICDQRADPVSSVGLRVNGEVLGWVLNHRAPPNFVVFTTAFVRKDFQRIGALFKLLVHSIVNIQNQGLCITFVTSSMYPRMLPFTLTRIGPYGDFCGETRGVTKSLANGAAVHA
jgi:GNAT superfamily N-acetyltransferase